MKTAFTLLFALATAAATAKSLEVKIPNVQSDKGKILVMVQSNDNEKPAYAMADAKADTVTIRIEGLTAADAVVSVFHDQDGDYQMKMGSNGPQEGYARTNANLPEEQNRLTLALQYPEEEQK